MTDVNSRLTLARLVDLAAHQIRAQVDYAPAELEKVTVAVRLEQGLTPEELWDLANQRLAQNGFTTVRVSGATTLSVVRLADAATLARLEDPAGGPGRPPAGFESRLVELRNRPVKETLDSIELLLSKPGGAATAVGSTGRR